MSLAVTAAPLTRVAYSCSTACGQDKEVDLAVEGVTLLLRPSTLQRSQLQQRRDLPKHHVNPIHTPQCGVG